MQTLSEITSKYSDILLSLKVLHLNAKSTPDHEHYGYGYDAVQSSFDTVLEQLMGYTNLKVDERGLNTNHQLYMTQEAIVSQIYNLAQVIIKIGDSKAYPNVSNLGQELSGVGSKLNYLLNLDK